MIMARCHGIGEMRFASLIARDAGDYPRGYIVRAVSARGIHLHPCKKRKDGAASFVERQRVGQPAQSIIENIGCRYNESPGQGIGKKMSVRPSPRNNLRSTTPYIVNPRVRIGHVHLKVADLQRALHFYSGVLGFEVTQRFGDSAVFLSAGGYHHHIALNTWESLGGSPPPPGTTGLYHTAIVYPSRAALADALRRVLAAKISLQGAADHGVSESIYLSDPDDNGVELYCDKPKKTWPRTPDGGLAMFTRPLDLHELLREAPPGTELDSGPPDL